MCFCSSLTRSWHGRFDLIVLSWCNRAVNSCPVVELWGWRWLRGRSSTVSMQGSAVPHQDSILDREHLPEHRYRRRKRWKSWLKTCFWIICGRFLKFFCPLLFSVSLLKKKSTKKHWFYIQPLYIHIPFIYEVTLHGVREFYFLTSWNDDKTDSIHLSSKEFRWTEIFQGLAELQCCCWESRLCLISIWSWLLWDLTDL